MTERVKSQAQRPKPLAQSSQVRARNCQRVLQAAIGEPWAITAEGLELVLSAAPAKTRSR
jgi:hypothetical protein